MKRQSIDRLGKYHGDLDARKRKSDDRTGKLEWGVGLGRHDQILSDLF